MKKYKYYSIIILLFLGLFHSDLLFAQCYIPTVTGPQPFNNIGIEDFFLDTYVYTSVTEEDYQDRTTEIIDLAIGASYDIAILDYSNPNVKIIAWLDWNRNDTFENNELVLIDSSGSLQNFTLPIPANTPLGTTKIRIAADDINNPFPTPCLQISGDVEDYTINFIENPMQILGSIYYHTARNSPLFQGDVQKLVLGIKMNTIYTGSPLVVTSIDLNLNGTENIIDVLNPKIWYTGSNDIFTDTNLFGSLTGSIGNNFQIVGSQQLNPGSNVNYFWLTLDIAAGATIGDTIDMACDSLQISGQNKICIANLGRDDYHIVNTPSNYSHTKRYNEWMFATNSGLNFSGTRTVVTNQNNTSRLGFSEANATICDRDGNLLFYTNGEVVWNRDHDTMPNGRNLEGDVSARQGAIITPVLNNPDRYYIFYIDGISGTLPSFKGLFYSVVDMNLDNGMGDVILSEKNILLTDTTCEKLAAVLHKDSISYWIVTQKFKKDEYHAFLVTCDGVSDTAIVSYAGNDDAHIGDIRFSSDGKQALNLNRKGTGGALSMISSNIQLLDFDNSTGEFTGVSAIVHDNDSTLFPESVGICFSPNDSLFFIIMSSSSSKCYINSYERFHPNIKSTELTIDSVVDWALMLQTGPDDKIYYASYNNVANEYIHVITNPNNKSNPQVIHDFAKLLSERKLIFGLNEVAYRLPWDKELDTAQIQSDTSICIGDMINIGVDSVVGYQYSWTPAIGLNDSSLSNPLASPSGTTKYILERKTVCLSSYDSVTITLPDYQTNFGSIDDTFCNTSGSIKLTGENGISYLWSTGNITDSIFVNESGVYILEAYDSANCYHKDSIEINIIDTRFFIPNAITPNGDNLNDILDFSNLYLDSNNFLLEIYSRRGEKIYETADLIFNPDVAKLNRKEVFVYKIKTKDICGNNIELKGNVIITN